MQTSMSLKYKPSAEQLLLTTNCSFRAALKCVLHTRSTLAQAADVKEVRPFCLFLLTRGSACSTFGLTPLPIRQ